MSDRVAVEGGELEYEVRGTGEPVLLIHGSHPRRCLDPTPGAAGPHRTLPAHPLPPARVRRQLSACRTMRDLPASRRRTIPAGPLGHRACPCRRPLVLVVRSPSSWPSMRLNGSPRWRSWSRPASGWPVVRPSCRRSSSPAGERYASGDKAGAVALFLQGACGPQVREVADQVLPPGAYDQAVADADTFFLTEVAGARGVAVRARKRPPASTNLCCSSWELTALP